MGDDLCGSSCPKRIVRPEPTDCSPPSQRIVHRGQQAGQTTHRRARPRFFFGKGSEKSRLRNRKSKFHKFLPSHPLFFWKWEGYFAAQEQKVEFHDFVRISSIWCLKTFHETLYIRFMQSGAGKDPANARIAYETPSVSVSRIFHKNPGRNLKAFSRLRNTWKSTFSTFPYFPSRNVTFFALKACSICISG